MARRIGDIPSAAHALAEPSAQAADTLHRARARIAEAILGQAQHLVQLGEVTLRPHQVAALARITALFSAYGGALLADETGLGKTFVALAVARAYEHVLIVAPAALRSTWEHALARGGVSAGWISFERLGRRAWSPQTTPQLVVIDEAHHLRNPGTRRYAACAALCARARVLLVSATPLQNARADLVAQLGLFLGGTAASMSDVELAGVVVRRSPDPLLLSLPELHGPHWIESDSEDAVLEALMALPAPVPAAGEGTASALVTYTLLRQWASSRAALVSALKRRRGRAVAMIASLESGRWPTRNDLAAWTCADESVQLTMPELFGATTAAPRALTELLDGVRGHDEGVRSVLQLLDALPDIDDWRIAELRDIRARHAGERVVVFSSYAETVRALARRLMPDGRVAELTARGARIASGSITRASVLAQLSPHSGRATPAHERIDLLIATDVLSEGIDLHAASVLVHLDLPWNPARLAQRVGRLRRLGAAHRHVTVYAFAPPASSERVLHVERRLRDKLQLASGIIGLGPRALRNGATDARASAPELTSAMMSLLEQWRSDCAVGVAMEHATVEFAAVRSTSDGFLAAMSEGAASLLLADIGTGASTDPRVVVEAVRRAQGPATVCSDAAVGAALSVVQQWSESRHARLLAGVDAAGGVGAPRLRARIVARIAALLERAPRHRRSALAELASRAQDVARRRLSVGAERALAAIMDSGSADESWLADVVRAGEAYANAPVEVQRPRLLAMIVFTAAP